MAAIRLLLYCVLLMAVAAATATDRHHEASLADAAWRLESGEKDCYLMHDIPGYGVAVFSRDSALNHVFRLFTYRPPREPATGALQLQRPSWQGHQRQDLGTIDIRADQTTVQLGHRLANRLLQELERGRRVLVSSDDWHGADESVIATLSQVGFRSAYTDYLACRSTFQEMRAEWRSGGETASREAAERSPDERDPGAAAPPALPGGSGLPTIETPRETPLMLYFAFDNAELTWRERDHLRRLAGELLSDPEQPSLVVTGHTDDRGNSEYNLRLGRDRAERARTYLVEQIGFPAARVTVETMGESSPQSSNADDDGQARNRRVQLVPLRPGQ